MDFIILQSQVAAVFFFLYVKQPSNSFSNNFTEVFLKKGLLQKWPLESKETKLAKYFVLKNSKLKYIGKDIVGENTNSFCRRLSCISINSNFDQSIDKIARLSVIFKGFKRDFFLDQAFNIFLQNVL